MTRLDVLAEFTTITKNGNDPAARVVNSERMADEIVRLRVKLHETQRLLNDLLEESKS
jgi:hypothetical protein